MKGVKKENQRLWRAVPDLTLDKLVLSEALQGEPVTSMLCRFGLGVPPGLVDTFSLKNERVFHADD